MNATERVMATISGKPVDRRALNLVLSLYGARLTGVPLDRYYTDPAEYVRAQSAVRKMFEPDIMFAPFVFALIAESFGSRIRWHVDEAPTVQTPVAASCAEMCGLKLPDIETHPHLVFIRETTRRMAVEYGREVPVAVPMPPPIDLPALIMGIDAWLELILFDREAAQRVLKVMTGFVVSFVNALYADGASFMAMPCALGSPAIVTRDMVTSFSRPAMIDALCQFRGAVLLHHGGAPFLKNLDLLTGLPRVAGYVVDQKDHLGQARSIIGPAPVMVAGINAPGLADMTADQVQHRCLAILGDRRNDPHFILGTCASDVPHETPPENIHAFKQAAEAFARGLP